MIERTLGIIKPDAVKAQKIGAIVSLIELNKFTIIGLQKKQLTLEEAENFYHVHQDKPFFGELVEYMISGPVVLVALEKESAIQAWRILMGATNPAKADVGTLRYMFGTSIGNNAVHGSDSPETAQKELSFFFPNL
ncbi:MAG TPA: nucleoside-diphosphate kinase [Candidatus Babeliaceae bacterium]|nr:nucleoside-diphosphate kinase [Candidatus Babeliaceae bacterium]